MLQTNKLVIYPTSRAIRSSLQDYLSQNGILPKSITIGDFEKKALLVKGRTFIDEDTRILLLKEASEFSTFKNLHIDREFFAFLKNSKFLFGFFEELAVELVDIEDLKSADVYVSYVEHLEILQTLLEKYKALLSEHAYCDKIILPARYTINDSYLESIDELELHLEGYLNNFEFELFMKIAQNKKVFIYLHTNAFNKKMLHKFHELGFALKAGHHYKLNLTSIMIEEETPQIYSQTNYKTFSSNSRILQAAFIKKSVYDFIELGIQAKDIVVILPNSSFADLLSLFNQENNFNFAMGNSYKNTLLYQEISALYEYAMEHYSAGEPKDAAALFEVLSGLTNDKNFSKALKLHWLAAAEKMSLDDFMSNIADMDMTQTKGDFYISAFTKEAQNLLDNVQEKGA